YGSGKSNMSCGSKAVARSSMGGKVGRPRARGNRARARVDGDRGGLLRRVALTQREAHVTRTGPDPDVVPVRPGEEIDAAAVGAEVGGRKDPVANRKLSQVMIDTLAAFHAVDPKAAGLETLGKPEGYLARQVKGWTERWERARTKDVAAAPEVIRWLTDHMP